MVRARRSLRHLLKARRWFQMSLLPDRSLLGDVDRDAEFARGYAEAGNVIRVLVGDDDGVEGRGIFTGELHTAEEFAATEAGVDEDAGMAASHNCAVAFGT